MCWGEASVIMEDLPNNGTPDAVGGAASVRMSNNKSRLPNIAKPTIKFQMREILS